MYVLHSFSAIAVSSLGREQFLALYLSSGVISSFASHVYKTVFNAPGLSLGAVSRFNLKKEMANPLSAVSKYCKIVFKIINSKTFSACVTAR